MCHSVPSGGGVYNTEMRGRVLYMMSITMSGIRGKGERGEHRTYGKWEFKERRALIRDRRTQMKGH